MLLEFSVTNFRSIKEKQTLSFLKTKLKSDNLGGNYTTITLSTGKTLDVLNTAVIYGANASGKSNIVLALDVMVDIIRGKHIIPFDDSEIYNIVPFLLDRDSKNFPTELEIDFIDSNGVRFVYGFSVTREKIIDEWLYQYPKGRPQVLIDRENTNTWGTTTALKGHKKTWQQNTIDNRLFLNVAKDLNSEQLNNVYNSILSIKPILDDFNKDNTSRKLNNNKEYKSNVLNFINIADKNIIDIEVKEDEDYIFYPPHEEYDQFDVYITRKIDDSIIKFNIYKESSGTQKIFALVSQWLDVLENGYTLILDELQNSLHPKLVEYLVKMFHNPKLNKNGAQLIFTTHETSLLDQNIFRRDQIWFCEKENNATEVFSLADFKVRKGVDDIEKAYLSGRYGAVPNL
jgi:AAA15 family ATPase/GTPase